VRFHVVNDTELIGKFGFAKIRAVKYGTVIVDSMNIDSSPLVLYVTDFLFKGCNPRTFEVAQLRGTALVRIKKLNSVPSGVTRKSP